MLTVCCFYWPKSCNYSEDNVVKLQSMVSRNLHTQHQFVCFSSENIEGVQTYPLDSKLIRYGGRFVKLQAFDPKVQEELQASSIWLFDLDVVILGNLDGLIPNSDIKIIKEFGSTKRFSKSLYNSSMVYAVSGKYNGIYTEFNGKKAKQIKHSKKVGTDQLWISEYAGNGLDTWSKEDGVLSFKYDLNKGGLRGGEKVVAFHGRPKPWEPSVWNKHKWIRGNYW